MMKKNKILIAGEGGQGIQVIAKILAKVAYKSGYDVTYMPNFGVEQRGGVSLAFTQISNDKISFPKFQKADIVVLLAIRAKKRVERYFDEKTILLFDNSLIKEEEISSLKNTKIAIPATFFAKEKLVPKVFNIIILGALMGEVGGLKEKETIKILSEFFKDKYLKEPQLKHFNHKALEMGMGIIKSIKKEDKWRQKILKK